MRLDDEFSIEMKTDFAFGKCHRRGNYFDNARKATKNVSGEGNKREISLERDVV